MTNPKQRLKQINKESSSFRDPSGFLYYKSSTLLRQVNQKYKSDYNFLVESGLLENLQSNNYLIPHIEGRLTDQATSDAYKIITPDIINFISYPYEWSFSQFKDAALLTLKIQRIALEHGMVLKDASAYNIQFHKSKPIYIDTLSFEAYEEGKPWVAYRQYCQHFLAPLALMSYKDIRLSQLLRVYIDGVPLDLATSLLPNKSYLNPGISTHIHIHAKTQGKYASDSKAIKENTRKMSKTSMRGLIDNLYNTTKKLTWKLSPKDTEWGDYYTFTNYSSKAFRQKEETIAKWVKKVKPNNLWDLGANDGHFSRLATVQDISTIAFDIDPVAVEKNYLISKHNQDTHMLPLLSDLTNPSSNIGWAHTERKSLESRGPTDLSMALALVHHLAISNNVPLDQIADYFAKLSKHLIIEFVPKNDSQVQTLLATREDVFPNYDLNHFIKDFRKHFLITSKTLIKDSTRTLLLLTRKGSSQA